MTQRLALSEKLLSIATRVRPGEGLATWELIGNAFLLLYSHYLLKVVRETLILSEGSALDKSLANALSAVAVGGVVFIYTLFYKKYQHQSRRFLLTLMLNGFFVVNILFFMLLIALDIRTPMIFYIWQSIYGILLVSHFWSYCADLLNQKSGKRLFPPIMIGATLGAWIGSLSASWVYAQAGVFSVLFAAMLCLSLATWLSTLAENKFPLSSKNKEISSSKDSPAYSIVEGFRLVLSKNYLLYIAAFVILMNWINTTGEFIFASYVKEAANLALAADSNLNKGELITHYYSSYYTWINLLGFLMQTFLVARLFRWIGIKGSILILPTVMILGYGLLALLPIFMIARLTMVVENSTSYSIANTTRNALFLPLDRQEKYLGKTTIDTFCWRLGDLIQFGVIFIGINYFSWHTEEFVYFVLALSVVMLWISWQIAQRYRQQDEARTAGTPPVVAGEIPSYQLTSGWIIQAKIAEDLFYDADEGDAFHYYLSTKNGDPLPTWIRFDRHNLLITFSPPINQQGEIELLLKVSDSDDLSSEVTIPVVWGNELETSDGLIKLKKL